MDRTFEESSSQPIASSSSFSMKIRGAKTHNLKSLDLDLPLGKWIAIVGPSGSGKSSLAFDTLHAEGQRRYLESQAVSSRQWMQQLPQAEVTSIENLPPTLAVTQKPSGYQPRSIVASITEIYPPLRVLLAHTGIPHCLRCGTAIERTTTSQMRAFLRGLPEKTRLMLLAPLGTIKDAATYQQQLTSIRKAGLLRIRLDGQIYEVEQLSNQLPSFLKGNEASVEAVVDRLVVRDGVNERFEESLQLTLKLGQGTLLALWQAPPTSDRSHWESRLMSARDLCPNCGWQQTPLQPRNFNFQSPHGACPRCEGTGSVDELDPAAMLDSEEKSLASGAIPLILSATGTWKKRYRETIEAWLHGHFLQWDQALKEWPEVQQRNLFEGEQGLFEGLVTLAEEEREKTRSKKRKALFDSLQATRQCPACLGSRLRKESRSVTWQGKNLVEILEMSVEEAIQFFQAPEIPEDQKEISTPLLREINHILQFLQETSAGYLTLNREAGTLSGGELQRLKLAAQLGSEMAGFCYILDEPSVGLHPRDRQRLSETLHALTARGNTLLMVEHDDLLIAASEEVVELGPGAGEQGGAIVFQDTTAVWKAMEEKDKRSTPLRSRRPVDLQKNPLLSLKQVNLHSLKNVDLEVPLNRLVVVTGVSGSGKSTLFRKALFPTLQKSLQRKKSENSPGFQLSGQEALQRVIAVDQSPLGRNARSTPATAIGCWDAIRDLFASLRSSKVRGFSSSRFSYNVKGGRCEACEGLGETKLDLAFLPDVWETCSICQGTRFNRQTLEIKWKERSIAEVLAMTVDEAAEFFTEIETIHQPLAFLQQVGVGYLRLGQSARTLSGGEAQRINLAREFSVSLDQATLYLFDEPTTGLQRREVQKLLGIFDQLLDQGHSVIVIEHHEEIMLAADWIIDLGPEGGERGGRIVATGPPAEIAKEPESVTGEYLRSLGIKLG
ncbi:UvrABC system protein A [Planctomycetales bacterium 10988]|nr:UvrABC system protein A [Planctomycetales bacterium 10988]